MCIFVPWNSSIPSQHVPAEEQAAHIECRNEVRAHSELYLRTTALYCLSSLPIRANLVLTKQTPPEERECPEPRRICDYFVILHAYMMRTSMRPRLANPSAEFVSHVAAQASRCSHKPHTLGHD